MSYPCSDCGRYCDPMCEEREERINEIAEHFALKKVRDLEEMINPNKETKAAIEAARKGNLIPVESPSSLFDDVNESNKPMLTITLPIETIAKVVTEVAGERVAQHVKWGEQNHTAMHWLPILGEEFGEACKAALEVQFKSEYPDQYPDDVSLQNFRKELIQVAAVAVAMVESLDRNELKA